MNKREFKTVFLGSQGIGKSCILQRIVFNQYDCRTAPTIGSTFQSKSIFINGEEIVFQLWDTAGQEQYRSLTKIYYQCSLFVLVYLGQESQIALLVYDVTRKDTFNNLQKWHEELREHCDKSNMILVLCGNKIDLDDEQVTYSEAKRFAEKIQAELFLVSAKTGQGIQEMFDQIGIIASQKYLEDPTFQRGKSKTLYQVNKKKKCC